MGPHSSRAVTIATFVMATFCVHVATGQNPCCWASQWEALLYQRLGVYNSVSNYASLAEIQMSLHADYDKQIMASEMNIKNGSITTDVKVIEDFKMKITYSIIGMQCFKTELQAEMAQHCIPEGSVYLGTQDYIGVTADTWFVVTSVNSAEVTTRVTVSHDKCTPMGQVNLMIADTSQLNIISTQNASIGIKDPSIFNVPDFCPKSYSVQVPPILSLASAHNSFKYKL